MHKIIKNKFIILSLVLMAVVAGSFVYYFSDFNFQAINNQEATVATVAWYASNAQSDVTTKAFGPSPRSEDTRTLFNPGRNAFWDRIKQTYNTIEIHALLLDDEGKMNPAAVAEKIALSDTQVAELVRLQRVKDFDIVVTAGLLGMKQFCNASTAQEFASSSVALEMEVFSRIYDAGGTIDEFAVDGPFLTLIQGSSKQDSCHSQGAGKTASVAAEYVAAYLTELKLQAEAARTAFLLSSSTAARGEYHPDISLVVNLPNWRIGNYLEMHWGTQAKRNVWPLHVMLEEFRDTTYPPLKTVLVDYPYSYISSSNLITTQQTGAVQYNNCAVDGNSSTGAKINCRVITPRESFQGKITQLAQQLEHLNGSDGDHPKMSFYVNTGDDYASDKGNPLCTTFSGMLTVPDSVSSTLDTNDLPDTVSVSSNGSPSFNVYQNNKCFDGVYPWIGDWNWGSSTVNTRAEANADQLMRDRNYLQETRQYYNLVQSGLPASVDVSGVYVTSWHTNPRFSSALGLSVAVSIDANH